MAQIQKVVYVGMVADILHQGHINILTEAEKLGRVVVGVLSDDAVATYKNRPVLSYEQRSAIVGSLKQVSEVVCQDSLDYTENLLKIKPDILIHGDDWRVGPQKEVRNRAIQVLSQLGSSLIEVKYTPNISSSLIKDKIIGHTPFRRSRILAELLRNQVDILRFVDLHSALSGLIAETTTTMRNGRSLSFDGMWASSLTDATSRGKPDIEVVDISSRLTTLQDVLESTTKPIIFDGDTGGLPEHFSFTVKSLERNGVSAVIIEDKLGLKKNSLLDRENPFLQEDVSDFANKIKAGKDSQVSRDFMVIARIESLILNKGIDDALIRANAYIEAGADAIMIHSRDKSGEDFKACVKEFRTSNSHTPLVAVPTSFNHFTDSDLWDLGINIVIYANHLLRASYPAMKKVAESILQTGSSADIEKEIMTMKEILTLIPGTD